MKPTARRRLVLIAISLSLGISTALTGCAPYSRVSQESSTTVRGSNGQIYGTINQSYTRTSQ